MEHMEHTVLCVDDEQNILNALKRLLRKENYRLLTANSGQAGLDLLAGNDVHVVVSDQRMPEESGVDFLARVRERWPETARIAITGGDVTLWAEMPGIYQVMPKGCSDVQFRLAVRNAARLFQLTRENDRMALEMRCLGPGAVRAGVSRGRPGGKKIARRRRHSL